MACSKLIAQEPRRFDVVVHELFADPSPVVGLPGSEFIELRNRSSTAFNLRNWKISDGSATATVSINYILMPDSMVVICPSASVAAYRAFGPAIGVTGFPSLNNDGDVITLLSPGGAVIHAIEYNVSWYDNAVKQEGGWTLEMIDVNNPCGDKNNWQASTNANGGTPGKNNSGAGVNPDIQPPGLLRTYTIDSLTIVAVFDEPLDSNAASVISSYRADHGVLVKNAIPLSPLFKQVYLSLNAPLLPGTVYTLQVSGVTDCSGNNIGVASAARAGLPSEAGAMDMVVNEILFNPPAGGADYVEFYNKSNKIYDASMLFTGNRNITGNIVSPQKLSEAPFLIFPGDYIVATTDAGLVKSGFTVRHPMNLLTVPQLPSLPDDKGSIALLNRHGTVIDELLYDEKWHFPLIVEREGISLERIGHDLPTQHKDNWTSAAADAGYGTPTFRNSQFKSHQFMQGKVEVSTPVFSPDGDGRDDLCFIHYQFPRPGNVASVTIYDVNGIAIRNLYSNFTLSEKGVFRWDGLDNKGGKSSLGVYIILAEIFSLDGSKRNFKNLVTLAHSF